MKNTWKRKVLALVSIPALSGPSAVGVYSYLVEESGFYAALSAAIGFETLYIGVNILVISTPSLRSYARNVARSAVITAVVFNTLAHYGSKVPEAFSGSPFVSLAFFLAVLASLPLAVLSYAVSVLLHELSKEESEKVDNDFLMNELALARPYVEDIPVFEAPQEAFYSTTETKKAYPCPHCGSDLPLGKLGAAKRWGHCDNCKHTKE